jgi:hypothetical protein
MDDQTVDREGSGDALAPRYSLVDIALSMALIAIGAASVVYVLNTARPSAGPIVFLTAWLGGGALIGAGIFHLVLRWWVGVVLGVFVQWMIAVFMLANSNF